MATHYQSRKKCSKCKVIKPVNAFHKAGFRHGKRQYTSACADCNNRDYRQDYARKRGGNISNPEHHKKYIRARSRALTRLSKLVPELYLRVLVEETEKEGIKNNIDWKRVGKLHYDKASTMDKRKVN